MTTEKKLFVAYYRVSTKRQGESGLGLEAQHSAVVSLVQQQAGSLIAEFTEVESGGGKVQRPQLEAAISRTRRHKAVLVVAKADRLSRNVLFTAKLLESGVDFVACDNPYANRLTIHILSAIAEHERGMISDRTTVALAAAKARGVKLGSSRPGHWEGREGIRLKALETARAAAAESHRRASVEAYQDIVPRMLELRAQGFGGDRIAKALMAEEVPSRRGLSWTGAHVRRVLKRLPDCPVTEHEGACTAHRETANG